MRPSRRRWWVAAFTGALPLMALAWRTSLPSAPPTGAWFVDVTDRAGITFRHVSGASGQKFMPETVGSGGAFLDYDNDGWLDVFLVNSAPLPGFAAGVPVLPALYRNNGDGTFTDVTRQAGLAAQIYGMGCAVGDYDNDGWADLYVSCVLGPSRLFHNQGNGTFEDVTGRAGVDNGSRWGTSAAWLDYDNDGRLDLFVCNYVRYTLDLDRYYSNPYFGQSYASPQYFDVAASALYRNRGNGTFEDVSHRAGIDLPGKALGVCPCDVDEDGWVDILVANDTVEGRLFRNRRDGSFEDVGLVAGIAVDEAGRARAGMGIDVADYRNDGGLAVLIGTFAQEDCYFFVRSRPAPLFADQASEVGLTMSPDTFVTFGVLFFDFDNDGWKDVFLANGHVLDDPTRARPGISFGQPNQLYWNRHDGTFLEVSASAGAPFRYRRVSRGCAYGDFDNDGKLDLLVTNNNGPVELLHNESPGKLHWLQVNLVGTTANRDAYGAEVRVTAGGITQRGWKRSGGSYLVQSMPWLHFGLGPATRVDRLEVRWPGGGRQALTDLPADHRVTLTQRTHSRERDSVAGRATLRPRTPGAAETP